MSDIHAALGLGQFARWPAMLERRRHIASLYTYALGAHFASQFQVLEKLGAMYYRLPIRVDGGLEAYEKPFSRKGITIRRGVDELLHRLRHLPDADFPNACTAYYKTISLPIYPAMSDSEIECAVRAASDILMVGRGS